MKLGAIIVGAITGAALSLVDAFFVMLLIGAAHSADARIPALGYGATFALVLAVSLVVGNSGRGNG